MKEILETSAGQSGVDDSRNGPFSNGFNTLVAETLESYKIPGLSIAVLDGANSWTKVRNRHFLASTLQKDSFLM